MISDVVVPVSCDGKGCGEVVEIEPEYKYYDYSGKSGFYDTSESAIEKKLEHEGWFIQDGKHYCCEDCVPAA